MLSGLKRISPKQTLVLVVLLFILYIVYNLTLIGSRVGEVRTSIDVVPENATISVDGKQVSNKTVYLKPGEYTFSASADGWSTDTQKVSVNTDQSRVVLLPEPQSEEIKKWLRDNPDVQHKREELGGQKFNTLGGEEVKNNPLIAVLPHTNVSPPFSIDFGPSKLRKGKVFLIISDASPNGRSAALDWIRQNDEDPTDYEIVFSGFINPLESKEQQVDAH